MDILRGFQIEAPDVFVPWGISEADLRSLLDYYGLRRITAGEYNISCVSLGGLAHELRLMLNPQAGGMLWAVGLFRPREYGEVHFDEFQKHLEACFGKPTWVQNERDTYPSYNWDLKGVYVSHYLEDRYEGMEEHVRIERKWPLEA